MEELIQQLRDAGFNDDEIREHIENMEAGSKPQHPLLALTRALTSRKGPAELAGAALQGATLGSAKYVVPGLEEQQKTFAEENPGPARAANFAGALATAPLLPFKAGLLARLGIGGGAAGVHAFNEAEGSIPERLDAAKVPALVGAGAGAVLPAAAHKVSKVVQKLRQPFRGASTQVAEGAGPLLADDAAAKMSELERLAPGTATPANITPGMENTVRVMGANAPLAREAEKASVGRFKALQTAKEGLSPQYQQLLDGKTGPLRVGSGDITPVLTKNGILPPGPDIPMLQVQALRNTLRGKAEQLRAAVQGKGKAGGPELNRLNSQLHDLTEWLEKQVPEIRALDKQYGLLSRTARSEEKVRKNLANSRSSYATNRVAGVEPGSPAGSLPGKEGLLRRMFGPDRAELAAQANRLLLQPGQIPSELLKARARAAQTYQPGLFAPFVIGGQTPAAFGLLE